MSHKIFRGKTTTVPFEIVQHIEKHWFVGDKRSGDNYRGIRVITKHTKWSSEIDDWENNIYLDRVEGDIFMHQWEDYIIKNL